MTATHRPGWRTPPPFVPTPEEIAQACARIQSTWTEHQRLARVADDSTRRVLSGRGQVLHHLTFSELADVAAHAWADGAAS